MMKIIPPTVFFLIEALFFLWAPAAFGQESAAPEVEANGLVRVFLESDSLDIPILREKIPFVEFVSTPDEADVFVSVVSGTSPEGMSHVIRLEGRRDYEGDNDGHTLIIPRDRDEAEARGDVISTLKMLLLRYAGKTPAARDMTVRFMEEVEPTAVEDPWDFWVFSLSGDTFMMGEKLYSTAIYSGVVTASRVTPELKVHLSLNAHHSRDRFSFEGTDIESSSSSRGFSGLVVKSLNEHWSIGAYISASSSTYSNIEFKLSPSPAVEFNVFPYSESTQKQLRLLYRLGFSLVRYREETIYEKTKENLWQGALSATLELKQPWGTVSTALEASHYFHDFSKNRLELNGEISVRLFKGFNFNVHGSYSRIRDQLSLARMGASLEEVLLRRTELATTYSYYVSLGLSYSFGSLKSNVVNPRFGDGGTSISISF